jgi:AraC-like DNA-binding protein
LPFMRDPLSADARLRSAIVAIVGPRGEPIDEARSICNLVSLADALVHAARDRPSSASRIDSTAVRQVRELLLAQPDAKTSMAELETMSGLTRWQLARQFRKAYGVSIYRFHLLRRLDRARELMRLGQPLADVAQSCGFADQAHLTRKFRGAFGLSPGLWRGLYAG